MHNFSNQFKNEMENDRRHFIVRMDVTTVSDEQFTITNANIWKNTFSIEEATSTSDNFTIGALIADKLCFSLNNVDDAYSDFNFIDATINLQMGMELSDGTVEMLQYGVFNIVDSSFTSSAINIVALDNLSKFSHRYDGRIKFPCYAFQIIQSCCYACRVEYDEDSIPNFLKSYRIQKAPSGDLTYSSLLSYLAQIACCYVKADIYGRLSFGWYELQAMNNSEDGGTFAYDGKGEDGEPESQLDGGSFDRGTPSYTTGDDYDAGTFRALNGFHIINTTTQSEIDTDDVRITGLRVTSLPANEEVDADTSFLGAEGYVITIAENPLIQEGQSAPVCAQIWSVISGMIFRPLKASILSDPMIEAGDVGQIADRNGNYYPCFFSSYKFIPDGICTVGCDAVSSNRQGAEVKTSAQLAVTQAVQQSRKWYAKAEKAAEDFQTLMANALGFYSTEKVGEDGSTIKYLHNKPKLESSDVQWKITIDGVAVSLDYGQTWTAGISKNGNMLLNVLEAVGINADWINAGTISGMRIAGGTISGGEIQGGKITGTEIKGSSLEGGTINIDNAFSVDAKGNAKINNLISGWINVATSLGSVALTNGTATGSTNNGSWVLTPTGLTLSLNGKSASISPTGLSVNGINFIDVASTAEFASDQAEKNRINIAHLTERVVALEEKVKKHTERLDNQLARIKALEAKIK